MKKEDLKELTNEELDNLLNEFDWCDRELLREHDERISDGRIPKGDSIPPDKLEEYMKNKYAKKREIKEKMSKFSNEDLLKQLNENGWLEYDFLSEFKRRIRKRQIDVEPLFKELEEHILNKYIELQRKRIELSKLTNEELINKLKEAEWCDKELLREYDLRFNNGKPQSGDLIQPEELEEYFRKRRENKMKRAS